MEPIILPNLPNLDTYFIAYSVWIKDFVGQNVLFFGALTGIAKWMAVKTKWAGDDKIITMISGIWSQFMNFSIKRKG